MTIITIKNMLKLKINSKPADYIQLANLYEIIIEFMEGDADGTRYKRILLPESKLPELSNELEEFLICIQACIGLDSKGRGGFENVDECISHYSVIENWNKFCKVAKECLTHQDYLEAVEDYEMDQHSDQSLFTYSIPTDEGWYTSYEALTIYYYNSEGNKFEVSIEIN